MSTENSIINLDSKRAARALKPSRLVPELDGYTCLVDLGVGHEPTHRHPLLAWSLMEDGSTSGLILFNGTLFPVQQLAHRLQGYCDPARRTCQPHPPAFVKAGLTAARDHFEPSQTQQCPDMAELQVAIWHRSAWTFKRLEMWHLQDGDIAPMIDYQRQTQEGPISIRVDARRYAGFAGLLTLGQVGQIKAGGAIQLDFYGLLARYRT